MQDSRSQVPRVAVRSYNSPGGLGSAAEQFRLQIVLPVIVPTVFLREYKQNSNKVSDALLKNVPRQEWLFMIDIFFIEGEREVTGNII
jgi:hypothetical protein